MAPEVMIKDLYARSTSGRGFSVGRENAEKLVEAGLATGLITSDRGAFTAGRGTGAAPASGLGAAPAHRQGDATIRVAAAGRLRSGGGSTAPAAGRTPAAPGATPPAAPAAARATPRPPRTP